MSYYYVCDHCGNLATIEATPLPDDAEFACDQCGSISLWEFTSSDKALEHAAHIRDILRSASLRRILP